MIIITTRCYHVFIENPCLREHSNEAGQKWKRGYLKPPWGAEPGVEGGF